MKELGKGELSVGQIARLQKITSRRVRQLREHFRKTGETFSPKPERKKRLKPLMPEEVQLVLNLRQKYKSGAKLIEQVLKKQKTPLPHNRIQAILNRHGFATPLGKKVKRKDWVRFERQHTNTMWHVDWTQLDDGSWLIAYEDDASRFITGYGKFGSANVENSLKVLRGAMAAFGRPKSMLTGRDVQFFTSPAEGKEKEPNDFQKFLEANSIQHIVGRVNHPQTNGKMERWFGTVKAKLHEFESLDELVHWYNHIRPHMSLNFEELETPAQAFMRKMHYKVKKTKKKAIIVEVRK
jgi:putative transposase